MIDHSSERLERMHATRWAREILNRCESDIENVITRVLDSGEKEEISFSSTETSANTAIVTAANGVYHIRLRLKC